jgi:hypothetical protein
MATFPNQVRFSLQPSGDFVSFDAGPLQGRVYQATGHVEIAGPDLAGNSHANLIHFAPPAVQIRESSVSLGAVISSTLMAQGLELKQKAGAAVVTVQLTFPHGG